MLPSNLPDTSTPPGIQPSRLITVDGIIYERFPIKVPRLLAFGENLEKGAALADQLAEAENFQPLAERAKVVNLAVGHMAPTKITAFVYKIAPELVNMKWGGAIEL